MYIIKISLSIFKLDHEKSIQRSHDYFFHNQKKKNNNNKTYYIEPIRECFQKKLYKLGRDYLIVFEVVVLVLDELWNDTQDVLKTRMLH